MEEARDIVSVAKGLMGTDWGRDGDEVHARDYLKELEKLRVELLHASNLIDGKIRGVKQVALARRNFAGFTAERVKGLLRFVGEVDNMMFDLEMS